MPITNHVAKGSLLTCDFTNGFTQPEMIKRRPVVVLSPQIKARPNLVTVVAISTTEPDPVMPYHTQIDLHTRLPKPFKSHGLWIKGDMVYAVGFHRLDLIRIGKDNGKRQYYWDTLSDDQLKKVQKCVLHGMGLSTLTKHL